MTEPVKTVIQIPLTSTLTRALSHDGYRERLIRNLAAECGVAESRLTSDVVNGHLVLDGTGDAAERVAIAALQPIKAQRSRRRVLDSWVTDWAPIAGVGTLVLTALALLVSWQSVTADSVWLLGRLVVVVAGLVCLIAYGRGANVGRVALGLSPALIVWGFAVVYAAQEGEVTQAGVPFSSWVDPILFSLSVALGGYLDYEVEGTPLIRFETLVEMLLTLSLLGGTLYAVAVTVINGVRREPTTDDGKDPGRPA